MPLWRIRRLNPHICQSDICRNGKFSLSHIRRALRRRRDFYNEHKEEIDLNNFVVLRGACLITPILFVIIYILAGLMLRGWTATVYHYAFVPFFYVSDTVLSVFALLFSFGVLYLMNETRIKTYELSGHSKEGFLETKLCGLRDNLKSSLKKRYDRDIDISMGVIYARSCKVELEQLIKLSDAAMYEAKKHKDTFFRIHPYEAPKACGG